MIILSGAFSEIHFNSHVTPSGFTSTDIASYNHAIPSGFSM